MAYRLPHPEAQPPKLDPGNVPEHFRELIPLAEKYGISDDGYRTDLIESLDDEELKECATFLYYYDQVLDEWLAGSESEGPKFTSEYIAFTALGMAADEAKMKIDDNT